MATSITGTAIQVGSIDLTTPLAVVDGGTGQTTIKSAIDTLRFTSAEQTITTSGSLTIPHGLGTVPFHVSYLLKCTTAEFGYSIGDLIVYNHPQTSTSSIDTLGFASKVDATNISIKFNSLATNVLGANNFSTGAFQSLTNANWRLIVKAEA